MKKLLPLLSLGLLAHTSFAQWNPNTSVNLETVGQVATDMQATNTIDGKTWIVYYHTVTGGYELYAQLLDNAGNKLLGTNGVLVDSNPSSSATFVFNICTDAEGNLYIGVQDRRNDPNTSTTVAYKLDVAGNNVWNNGAGVVLGTGYSPYPAIMTNGDIVFAWSGNDNKINMQRLTNNGVALWATPKSFAYGAKSSRGQMVPLSDGGYLMAFQNYNFGTSSKLYAQRFNTAGDSLWTSSVLLSNEATSTARYYSVAHESDTMYVGYYTSTTTNHFNSWLQRVNPDGTLPYGINGAAFADYSTSAEPHEQTTKIAINTKTPHVWAVSTFSNSNQTTYGVYVQKFEKATGNRLLGVNGKEIYPLSSNRFAQQGNLTLKGNYPVFMVASDQSYLIKGTVLNENGDFILPGQDVELSSTLITQPSSLNKGRLAFTNNVNSQSVALWTENRGTEYRVYAQNFLLNILDTSVAVATVNSVPATISTAGGTLGLNATVLPASASQNVTWSIMPGTGAATIAQTGVVTAVSNGTVWAKAVSVAAPTYMDSILITITNQGTNSINAIEKALGLNVFPNPAEDALYIEIKNEHPQLELQLLDINGRSVIRKSFGSNAFLKGQQLDLSKTSPGVYFIKLNGQDINISKKITVR